ncbi:hypothetical protein HLI03_31580 [Rhizobium laguerreae]|uniref:hypothetical protein n=1 Tax=Rhizobium laguerreae TaxID=1076926 RepID=UPI00147919C1|nr:hypothetical protein [Rhizobium laguerreae]NNH46139.1 hypothetical protein [Rhizobium laguerreae]
MRGKILVEDVDSRGDFDIARPDINRGGIKELEATEIWGTSFQVIVISGNTFIATKNRHPKVSEPLCDTSSGTKAKIPVEPCIMLVGDRPHHGIGRQPECLGHGICPECIPYDKVCRFPCEQ